jgi:hypothetical protein
LSRSRSVRVTGDHHPAVAVPAEREGRFVATGNDLGDLVDMGVEVRRSVCIDRAVQLQPGQGHRLDLMTVAM